MEVKVCEDLVFDDVLIILSRNEKEQIFPVNNSFESVRAEEAMHDPEESISNQEDLESLRISEADLEKNEETNQLMIIMMRGINQMKLRVKVLTSLEEL